MPPIIDAFPYPWHDPVAQELHIALTQLYPTPKAALFVAAKAGLDVYMLNAEQPPLFVWKDVLEAGATAGRNRALVTLARDQNPSNPRRPLLDAVLADAPIAMDRQPRDADGRPIFLKGTDAVTEKEALLFHDDLTLAIGRIPWLIAVLGMLQTRAPSVCRLEVSRYDTSQRGTAFRIGPDLLLTNSHVLQVDDQPPTAVTAEFGYEDDGKGGVRVARPVACDVTSVRHDAADDWGVIRVADPLPDDIPTLKLSDAAMPIEGSPAFIIQHPGGERKRVAYVRNQITDLDDVVVHYLSDTQFGSSGAPVLNDAGQLIALHRAGGMPQDTAGKPPLQKNEGLRISRVVAALAKAGIAAP